MTETERASSGHLPAEGERPQPAPAGPPPLRAAVLGSANVRVLRAAFMGEAAELLPDRKVETSEVPYGQLRQELLDPNSSLRRWRPDLAVFCDRLEDLVARPRLDGVAPSQIETAVREYAELLAAFHSANDGWVIVHRFARCHRSAEAAGGQAAFALVDEMNGVLAEGLATLPQVLWVDVAAEAAAAPLAACDPMLWHLGRMPFSEVFSQRLARRWMGLTLAMLGKTARVVVLDLDNTLWGGVLGEDGLSGIRIGGDYPGNAYTTFQRALKTLPGRGIGLAVCSRNDRDLALQALKTHSAMLIRPADLVATRIDWRPKWENVREIAEELNLGLESLLFVDDNPIEREQIRLKLPEVKILDLPASPAFFAEALADCPWLESAGLTAEDAGRVRNYQTQRKVREERQAAASLDEFYAGLGMQLYLQPLADSNLARAVQLSQKTNQFNTTTRRYDQRTLSQLVATGGDVVVVGLEDRHLQFENIGLIILRPDPSEAKRGVVDCYLLSCRVLGRGLETAVLKWAVRRAAHRGWTTLSGAVTETPRNTPVRSVFADAGFEAAVAPGEWVIRTDSAPEIPSWFTIHDRMPPV
ncbi:MAG TPA: HAD-IIIC family phosphatase [Planctomycetaceae bacterium]|nr:HAD-IIIC family phosphatase [Planctomycetaceae bacterium]